MEEYVFLSEEIERAIATKCPDKVFHWDADHLPGFWQGTLVAKNKKNSNQEVRFNLNGFDRIEKRSEITAEVKKQADIFVERLGPSLD